MMGVCHVCTCTRCPCIYFGVVSRFIQARKTEDNTVNNKSKKNNYYIVYQVV